MFSQVSQQWPSNFTHKHTPHTGQKIH